MSQLYHATQANKESQLAYRAFREAEHMIKTNIAIEAKAAMEKSLATSKQQAKNAAFKTKLD